MYVGVYVCRGMCVCVHVGMYLWVYTGVCVLEHLLTSLPRHICFKDTFLCIALAVLEFSL